MRIHARQSALMLSLLVLGFGTGRTQDNLNKAQQASAAEVTGTVVNADGKPVPNAEVLWIEDNHEERTTTQLFTERTDAQGKFRFAQPRPKAGANRNIALMVQPLDGAISFKMASRVSSKPTTIRIVPATTLRLSFVDPLGKPVPNMTVRLRNLNDEARNYLTLPDATGGRWVQKTDAKGECYFRGLPQGSDASFAITDERFAALGYDENVTLTETATQTAPPIRLKPGGIITGRVTYAETGKPAANLQVGAGATGYDSGGGYTKTDADGNYRITNILPGHYNVTITLRGDMEKNWTTRALEKVEVKPGGVLKGQDFRLISGVVLSGKVTEKGTGKPIEGIRVGIHSPAHPRSSSQIQSRMTDANGAYTVRVPPGDQYVYISGIYKENYERPQKGFDLKFEENRAYTQDFILTKRIVRTYNPVKIKVVGIDGKPIANAKVVANPISSDTRFPPGLFMSHTETDEQGNVEVEMRTASVRLRARSGTSATPKTILAQSGDTVTLTLKPNALVTLTGQVIDDKGKPIPGAKVAVYEWIFDMGSGRGGGIPVDAQGRYTFSNLWADSKYSLMVEAPGYGKGNVRDASYPAGKKNVVPAIALQSGSSFVAGRVVDGNGEPIAKQRVLLEGRSNKFRQTYSDAQGKFRFAQLVKEPVSLMTLNDDYSESKEKTVQTGDSGVILVKTSPNIKTGEEDWEKQRAEQVALINKNAPEWAVESWLNTTDKMPDTLKGKIVLIDFWAMWCGPCVAVLPAVQRVHEEYSGKGVVVIGLSGDSDLQKLKDFVKAKGLTYPIAMDISDPKKETFGSTMLRYKISGIPEVAVIDRKGVLRYLDHGLDGAVGMIGEILSEDK